MTRTPTTAPSDSYESNLNVARRLQTKIPGGVILDQYCNPNNPLAHYLGTGSEIVEVITSPSSSSHPTSGKVDVVIAGAGTGGTLAGVAKRVKEHNSSALIVGIDPVGSVIARPHSLNSFEGDGIYKIEGLGYDFTPEALSYDHIDVWLKSNDDNSFSACRRLIRTEGLLCGGSSGSAVNGALEFLKDHPLGQKVAHQEGANVVVVLPDSLRNYITKDWLVGDEELAKAASTQKDLMALANS